MKRTFRVISAVTAGALVLGAFGGVPATAKKKKFKCPAFVPAEPQSNSEQTAEALEAEVQKLTKAHTESKPLVIEYEHGAALWTIEPQMPVQEDTVFFNIHIWNKKALNGVYARMEWAGAQSDMDMYWYDSSGTEIYNSGAFNTVPVDASPVIDFSDGGNGGTGFESASGFPLAKCAQLTIESRAFMTQGESMTLKLWYGEIQEQEE